MFFYIYIQATQDELKASYRRLCMLYHPDKHRDPELKRQAEQLFNLVHKAYEGTMFLYTQPFNASVKARHFCCIMCLFLLSKKCFVMFNLTAFLYCKHKFLIPTREYFMIVILFASVVLSDPQSRAIYDVYGKRGLDVEGWEVS